MPSHNLPLISDISTIPRAMIIHHHTATGSSLTVEELAELTGLPITTVAFEVDTLIELGFLTSNSSSTTTSVCRPALDQAVANLRPNLS
ncbi:helix-turn-helix domain-containing protein [Arthrobacter russicus]|jgi:DNA-binding IclR family transcriptional regulator|uniref:helix-turn-helix domain-containing protein n=1 Tax=Arthrobacter russicus TaxID=172040 RepID=UPI003CF93C20